jgi:hypothetical protein
MKIKNIFSKFMSVLSIVALVTVLVGPQFANAASLTGITDTMSRQKIGVASTHKIVFKSTSAIPVSSAGITLSIPYSTATTFTGGTFVVGDITGLCHGPSTGLENGYSANCTANNETISAGAAGANQWGFTTSGSNPVSIVLAAPTTFAHTIAAGDIVTLFLASTHMINPASVATPNITITTTSDTGNFTVPIVDDDTVAVSASVNETITFDINASTTGGASVAPYLVHLGTLSTSSVAVSNGSSTPETIGVTGGTNASGGMSVTINNANGVSGLVSTSKSADFIPSATATMSAGTPNYGLCVATVGLVGWTRAGSYGTTCALNSQTNGVVALSTTPATILSSTGPLASTANAYIAVNAAISATTPAHTDYADTLNFDATGTF